MISSFSEDEAIFWCLMVEAGVKMMVRQQFRQFVGKVILVKAGILLGLSLSLTAIAPSMALATPLSGTFLPHLSGEISLMQTIEVASRAMTVHLYGTSAEAQQLGQNYMVLQVGEDNHVQGVFYQVNSEFACFEGEINQGKLDLAVIDPFEQVAYGYQMDYAAGGYVAEGGDRLNAEFVPAGYQVINTVSTIDHELLARCSESAKPVTTVEI